MPRDRVKERNASKLRRKITSINVQVSTRYNIALYVLLSSYKVRKIHERGVYIHIGSQTSRWDRWWTSRCQLAVVPAGRVLACYRWEQLASGWHCAVGAVCVRAGLSARRRRAHVCARARARAGKACACDSLGVRMRQALACANWRGADTSARGCARGVSVGSL